MEDEKVMGYEKDNSRDSWSSGNSNHNFLSLIGPY